MRLGIMQPYFFPYIGYFSLIKNVDKFIVLDDVQFIRHGWIERNRILKPTGGWQYIAVPLMKHSQTTLIKDIRINNEINWKSKILAQMEHYRKAPNYRVVRCLVEEIFAEEYKDITTLNLYCIRMVAKFLEINTPIELFRDMGIQIETPLAADEWALNICKALPQVTEYWNPPGGQSFFSKEKYKACDISLCFQEMEILPYRQKGEFEGGLSILDVMMFNSKDDIREMLDRYRLYE